MRPLDFGEALASFAIEAMKWLYFMFWTPGKDDCRIAVDVVSWI